MATALFRFIVFLTCFGLLALLAFALNNDIAWLTIAVTSVLWLISLAALFLVLYVVADQGR